MARLARVIVEGAPHHVVQRGNRGQDVFFSDADREAYLEFVKNACEQYGVRIWSWCLMKNHVHMIAVPDEEDSLSRCFADAHVRYTRMINFRERWRGHLWQSRFGSSPMDETHLLLGGRYVERNPVRAEVVSAPWDYEWSSAKYHVGLTGTDPLIAKDDPLPSMVEDWRAFLSEPDDDEDLHRFRKEARVGRPLGSKEFIVGLEKRLGRMLRRRTPGRPRKAQNRTKEN